MSVENEPTANDNAQTTVEELDAFRARFDECQPWLAIRKEAGLRIDPETAEVEWIYAQTLDPYGIHPKMPDEFWQVGREYFARSPGSDVWVWFGDLPDATRDALRKRHVVAALVAYPGDADFDECPF